MSITYFIYDNINGVMGLLSFRIGLQTTVSKMNTELTSKYEPQTQTIKKKIYFS